MLRAAPLKDCDLGPVSYHGIMEWAGLGWVGRGLKDDPITLPTMGRDTFHHCPIQPGPEQLQGHPAGKPAIPWASGCT